METRMTYNQKRNRMIIIASYASVHGLRFEDVLEYFIRAFERYSKNEV